MSKIAIADTVASVPHIAAWEQSDIDWYNAVDLTGLLIYAIDTVPEVFLPFLAEQFDVLGNKGWELANTVAQQRALLKKAVELHRYKGTAWSIKEALKSIGFGNAVLTERVDDHWAKFRLTIDLGERALDQQEIDKIVALVNAYKPARCLLADITYTIVLEDTVGIVDDGSIQPAIEEIENVVMGVSKFANGEWYADGSIDASRDGDILEIQIIPV